MTPPQSSNSLGGASLGLGIASVVLVFGISLCALTGAAQNWLNLAGTPLFVCGGSSAFLGLIGAILGFSGLFGKNKPRALAIVGMVLGLAGLCLFLVIMQAVSR